jgi:hypothetical protein
VRGDEEQSLSREELVAREWQARRLEHEELQRLIEERCREAEARWRAAHPWLAPGWCVTVPVRRVAIPDPGHSENPEQ